MRYVRFFVSLILIPALAPYAGTQASEPTAEVVVAPFIVDIVNGDTPPPRAQTDKCFEQLAEALKLKGVAVARDSQLTEKNLRSASAPWAVLGRVSRKDGKFQLELRLLEVKSGDEMRSYFNSDRELQMACLVVEKAAERIALFVEEQRR